MYFMKIPETRARRRPGNRFPLGKDPERLDACSCPYSREGFLDSSQMPEKARAAIPDLEIRTFNLGLDIGDLIYKLLVADRVSSEALDWHRSRCSW